MGKSSRNSRTPKIVHVVGTGTIGEPTIGLLAHMKKRLGIDEVTFHKKSPLIEDRAKINNLINRGAKFVCEKDKISEFDDLGYLKPSYETVEAIRQASVVIDCTPKGIGHRNKMTYYDKFKNQTLGFIAQGSEFGFGKMYAKGINDEALDRKTDQFIQIVSCNTHALGILLKTLAADANGKVNNLEEGRFVLLRRANDISQEKSFIPAPQAGVHSDETFGTHHARDAHHLFKTLNVDLNVFSSAMKLNTQYMHSLWFSLRLKNKMTKEEAIQRLVEHPQVAVTYKKGASEVFSFGRDQGYFGRILTQVVVCLPTIEVISGGRELVGFAFTPQDGNSLLSTIAATLWYLFPEEYQQKLDHFKPYCYQEV
jgi:glyceraldehyde-3-phosphate dehydrogenase type II